MSESGARPAVERRSCRSRKPYGPLLARSPGLNQHPHAIGANDYGHPSGEVIAVLEAAGSRVLRTDRDGDVTVRLDRLSGARRRVARRRYGGGDEAGHHRRRPP